MRLFFKLDADALNAELSIARQQGFGFLDGLNDLSIVSEDSNQDSFAMNDKNDRIELSREEEQLQLREEEVVIFLFDLAGDLVKSLSLMRNFDF